MPPRIRLIPAMVALAGSISSVALGQTVCDQLLPIGLVPPAGGFQPGCASRYVLRPGTVPPPPASWLPIAYPACPNGPCAGLIEPLDFVCEATVGYACCIAVADSIPLLAGAYLGPFRQGFDQRFANDSDVRADICFAEYAGNGTRVANVPLIHSFGLGTTKVEVTWFGRMFIVGPPAANASIVVEFIDGPTPVHGGTWGRTKIRYR